MGVTLGVAVVQHALPGGVGDVVVVVELLVLAVGDALDDTEQDEEEDDGPGHPRDHVQYGEQGLQVGVGCQREKNTEINEYVRNARGSIESNMQAIKRQKGRGEGYVVI